MVVLSVFRPAVLVWGLASYGALEYLSVFWIALLSAS